MNTYNETKVWPFWTVLCMQLIFTSMYCTWKLQSKSCMCLYSGTETVVQFQHVSWPFAPYSLYFGYRYSMRYQPIVCEKVWTLSQKQTYLNFELKTAKTLYISLIFITTISFPDLFLRPVLEWACLHYVQPLQNLIKLKYLQSYITSLRAVIN